MVGAEKKGATPMPILWLIAKIVFSVFVVALGYSGDITLGEYLIIMALLWFVGDHERRGR